MIPLIISYSDSMPTQQLQPQELQVPLLDWLHTMSMVQHSSSESGYLSRDETARLTACSRTTHGAKRPSLEYPVTSAPQILGMGTHK